MEIWTEKYRPKKIDDIINQEEIKRALKSFVKNKNMPHLLFAGPPGTGKCLTGDTLVLTKEYGLEEIGKIIDNNLKENGITKLDISVYTPNGWKRINYAYKGKVNKIVLIKTRNGRVLKVTPEHPFLVNDKGGKISWKKAEELEVGEKIATPRRIVLNENSLDKRELLEAEFLGYILSDGYIADDYRIRFCNNVIVRFR